MFVGVDASSTWGTTNGGLYIYYNHVTNEIAVNRVLDGVSTSTPYSVDTVADTLIGKTVEYYITFATEGDTTKAVIYIENTKIAEVSLDAVGLAVHAYSRYSTMTIESVAEEAALIEGTAAYRSTDVNNNGAIDEADSSALRSVLVGKEAEKETVFGVISDTHFLGNGGDTDRQERFEKALNYYREQGAELIILNADLTDYGNAGSYQALINIANEVYKDTPAELRPQFVSTADNHEFYESWDFGDTTPWGQYYTLNDVASRFSTYLSELDTKLTAGDTVPVIGPLGNGFPLEKAEGKKAFLMGGGIGVPPILELAKQLNCEKQIVVGYRDEHTFLREQFEANGALYISTEDGSVGTKGNVMNAIAENGLTADIIYACGPTPMLRAIKNYAEENGIECYISLEEKMACGIGACLACTCKSKEKDHHTNVHNKRICKDGPVFLSTEVEI